MIPARRSASGNRAAAELAALVRESVAAGAGREVLHLRLASLAPALRRPHHRRLLRDALAPALGAARSRVFDLPNGDVVAVAPPPAPGFGAAAEALGRALEGARGAAAAVRRLSLPDSAAQILTAAAESLGLEPAPAPPAALPGPDGLPPDTADLAAAERALAAADLGALILAQSVCRMDPEGEAPQPAWEDRRLAWPALAAQLLPGLDLGAAPALARRLARAAEARMLAELTRPAALMAWRPVGLALSPATLEGPAFARFVDALPAGRAGGITIGLRPAELLADPGAVARIGPALRGRGFQLALDDAEAGLVALLPPDRLGLDLLRLRWSPALPGAIPDVLTRLLAEAPERVVLAGVDRPAAIAWGWEAGIRLFQGPLVERRRRAV